jgi:hypothetical protein
MDNFWIEPKLLVEHDQASPGLVYEHRLFVENNGCIFNDFTFTEAKSANENKYGHLVTFQGKFQEAEAVNKNKRLYPRVVLENNVKGMHDTVNDRGLCGELDHPTDSIVHFKDTSHLVTKLWWEGNSLMGEGQILNTPCGKLLKALIDDGVRVGISSRGVGNGKVNEEGILVIGESYRLITFDAVADPSTYAAFQKKVVSRKNEGAMPPENYDHNITKNEVNSIHINKDILLAALIGEVKKQTSEIKARLFNG